MILIADSGSTKADWVLLDHLGNSIESFSTKGFNPFFHDSSFIVSELCRHNRLLDVSSKIGEIKFYGAGCSNKERNDIIITAFQTFFKNANIHVGHDLDAAVFATSEGKPCISCIIGTGSNSAVYNGMELSEVNPALGYVLGDEGSGSYLGKRFLTDFLYDQLPEDLLSFFLENNPISKDIVLENVYNQPHANVYLASFAKFLSQNTNHPYVRSISAEAFSKFLKYHVACFENYQEVPIHFVGSVAYFFKEILIEECNKIGANVGNIVKKPIDGLAKYHKSILKKTAA